MPKSSKPVDDGKISDFQHRFIDSAELAAQHFKSAKEGPHVADDEGRTEIRRKLLEPNDVFGIERILGKNDLLPINYFSRGLQRGRSVCKVHIHRPNGVPDGFGTGFMVSPILLLTNNHVLPSERHAERSWIEFDYEYDENFHPQRSHHFSLEPHRFFYTNPELDFTLVAVSPVSHDGTPLREFGFLELIEASGKALLKEKVSLIQHPRGMRKQVAIRENKVLDYFDDFVFYETDTEPGSSGSPVFNDQWEVVAVHNSGVPKTDGKGNILKQNGKRWKPGDPDDTVNWIANQGIRISSIFKHLKSKVDWQPSEVTVLEEFGAFSRSTLNQEMAKLVQKEHPAKLPNKLPNQPVPPVITYSELLDRLKEPDITEADFAPYFILADADSDSIDPNFIINRELVIIDTPQLVETAQLLNWANWISRKSREIRYNKAKPNAKVKIVAEGDSWFQYPILLNDVIDHLMAEEDLAILCFSGAGDLLKDMVAKAEFNEALRTENPNFFLISGGGNDLVAGSGLKRLLRTPDASFQPFDLINWVELALFKAQIVRDYTQLFGDVLTQAPAINILCHGYSYPVPNRGRWLGGPMESVGIVDRQVQQEVIRIIFDEINAAIRNVAESFPKAAHYLDVKSVVPAHGWYDELHPISKYYGAVAAVFKEKILELSL
jgi:V8-like Glu-specific endopeptidase